MNYHLVSEELTSSFRKHGIERWLVPGLKFSRKNVFKGITLNCKRQGLDLCPAKVQKGLLHSQETVVTERSV